MSASQHTPGPWVATISNRGTPCIISIQGNAWICGELSNGNGEDPGESQGNTRLISAAPDLLAALFSARAQLEAYEQERSGETFNDTQINDAIAKAEGH